MTTNCTFFQTLRKNIVSCRIILVPLAALYFTFYTRRLTQKEFVLKMVNVQYLYIHVSNAFTVFMHFWQVTSFQKRGKNMSLDFPPKNNLLNPELSMLLAGSEGSLSYGKKIYKFGERKRMLHYVTFFHKGDMLTGRSKQYGLIYDLYKNSGQPKYCFLFLVSNKIHGSIVIYY